MKIVAGPYGYRGLILKTRKIRHFGQTLEILVHQIVGREQIILNYLIANKLFPVSSPNTIIKIIIDIKCNFLLYIEGDCFFFCIYVNLYQVMMKEVLYVTCSLSMPWIPEITN